MDSINTWGIGCTDYNTAVVMSKAVICFLVKLRCKLWTRMIFVKSSAQMIEHR
jgi:hypothetical protein